MIKRFLRPIILEALIKINKNNPKPRYCSLFMTEICNLKCKGCRRSTVEQHRSNELKLDTIKQLLKSYPGIKSFCIAGQGEPTLCSNFVEIVDYLKSRNKYVLIVTNGTNTEKFNMLQTKPDRISISLYGYDNQSYLSYCGANIYERIVENFKLLKSKFNNVGFSYIVNRENYEDLEKIINFCDNVKPEFLTINNYLAYDPDNFEETNKIITVNDKEIVNFINNICKNKAYIDAKPEYIDINKPIFKCSSYHTTINLDGNGNISCCLSQIPPDADFGNIFNDKNPFNSETINNLRKQNYVKNCFAHENCKYCFRNWQGF